MSSSNTVLVTGASGFIARHIIQQLLKLDYHIVGTVRSPSKASELLEHFHHPAHLRLSVVSDIATLGAFDNVLTETPDIDYVIHAASPVSYNDNDFVQSFYEPAIQGTKNILRAVKQYGHKVKKIVVTSSIVTMPYRDDDDELAQDTATPQVLNEKSWNNISWESALALEVKPENVSLAYTASKTFAEQEVWEFVKTENPSFAITTIIAPLVFGPLEQDKVDANNLNVSNKILYNIYTNNLHPENDKDNLIKGDFICYVDVRDLACAHIKALTNDAANGQRWIITPAKRFYFQQLVDILHDRFDVPELARGLPGHYGDYHRHQAINVIDNSLTLRQSGMEFRSLEETIVDFFTQVLSK